MAIIAVDLGSTNTKAALYDERLHCLARSSVPVQYVRRGGLVEFDAADYLASLQRQVASLAGSGCGLTEPVRRIVLTGQGESLVVLGGDGRPLCPAISWMDERSRRECRELEQRFPREEYRARTGQLAVLPTWPASKILWLRRNRPEVFQKAAWYLLLKDYVVYALTGRLLGDMSIATFSFYFDIRNKCYWPEMLEAVGIREEQLPPLAEPCSDGGALLAGAAEAMGLDQDTRVNIGTLDHFAGMIGTGNIHSGRITLSTGTVMTLAAITGEDRADGGGIPLHYGFLPDTYVLLPVCESGGVCLEWFQRRCLPDVPLGDIDAVLTGRAPPEELLFLPYISGTNAPEMDPHTCGAFFGLRVEHDAYDMAYSVMEGVAHLLRKNCDAIRSAGTPVERIVATGGGAKSDLWCALQANITGVPVEVPVEREAACLGAAIIGAVDLGLYPGYAEAIKKAVGLRRRFEPVDRARWEKKHRRFLALYEAMVSIQGM